MIRLPLTKPFTGRRFTGIRHGSLATVILVAITIAAPTLHRETFAAEFGIEKRVPWTTSRLVGSPEPPRPYTIERVFPALSFNQPVELIAVPGTNRLAVIEVGGKIYSFENKADVAPEQRDLMLDVATLDPKFTRVYGIAFHPKFAENRTLFISYVLKSDDPAGSRVSKFKLSQNDPPRIDPKSEEIVITWMGGGHNGAHLQFGPDGMLYISTGDGGSSFPPDGRNTGQDVTDLLASVLRVDVDQPEGEKKYRIPSDNPFVKLPGARGEVYAFGLRNPWKMSFDPADGSLWVADVGWEMWEMVYRIVPGGNYGWSLMEASQPVHTERVRGPTPILPPTVAHDHTESRSITGGYFSQTSRLPELKGAYIYGDYVTGIVWALKHEGDKVTWRETLVDTPLQIVTFGVEQSGDVLMVDYAGTIHRLVPNPRRTANADFPKRLSETGLFASTKDHRPAPGVIPYSINAEPWADNATAERFVALPGTSQLDLWDKTDVQLGMIAGEWRFPDGGVLAKTIFLEMEPGNKASRRRVETQVLHYDVDTWRGYNYIWNDEQTDAVLAGVDGTDQAFKIKDNDAPNGERQQTWHHAGRTACIVCHTTRAASIHGFRAPQLAREQNYYGTQADQLATLDHIGLFAKPLPKKIEPFCDPYDVEAPLEARARSYLHVNCAHCHRRGGGGSAAFDAQITLPLDKTNLVGSRPTQGTFNIPHAAVVTAGDPYRSVLFYRMMKLGSGRMPQFGSNLIDDRGMSLIRDWIRSLTRENGAKALDIAVAKEDRFQDATSPAAALEIVDSLRDLKSGGLYSGRDNKVIAIGLSSSNPLIRDLFERYVPEEQRIKKLGAVVKPDAILALKGDAERGRLLFAESKTVQCRNCHKVGEVGRAIGPELTLIGKKLDKAKLLESLLEPSKTIDPQFAAQLVETKDGQVLTGLLVSRDDKTVILRLVDGKEAKVAVADIELMSPQQKSLMPDLLLKEMTAAEVVDLLEYLSQRK